MVQVGPRTGGVCWALLALATACGGDSGAGGPTSNVASTSTGTTGSTTTATSAASMANSTSSAAGAGGTGSTANTTGSGMLSYAADVAPIFEDRCTDCHHASVQNIPNIVDPFDPTNGLLVFPNTWLEKYPDTPAMTVVAGQPEESFLMDKISDMALEAGNFMPWSPVRLTAEEVAMLRQWVSDGAMNDTFYQESVKPIFGTAGLLGAPGGKCNYCHHSTGILPNLSDPFDPVNGVVNIAASIRPYTRVVPGDPDSSLLIIKVEAAEAGAHGEPMPMEYPALSAAEVDTVRQWIAEGAQNN